MLDKIFLFAGEHFFLVTTFILLLGVFFYTEMLRGGETVSPQQLANLINKEDALVIDLRSGDAFRKGHIHGSENVPEDKFDGELARLEKLDGRPIILVCELGSHSAAAGRKLLTKKVKRVYRLKGGIDAWLAGRLPLVKG